MNFVFQYRFTVMTFTVLAIGYIGGASGEVGSAYKDTV